MPARSQRPGIGFVATEGLLVAPRSPPSAPTKGSSIPGIVTKFNEAWVLIVPSGTPCASWLVAGSQRLVVMPPAALVSDQSDAPQNQEQRTRLRSRNASRGSVVEYRNQSADVVSPAHRRPLIGAKICVARHHGRARGANRLRTALGFVQGEIGWGVRGAGYRHRQQQVPVGRIVCEGSTGKGQ